MFKMLRGLFSSDLSIDLGTANTLIYLKGQGIILDEPSVVAIKRTPNGGRSRVIAVGSEAKAMLGRTPENIQAIRPLRDGVVAELQATEYMLQKFIRKIYQDKVIRPSPRVLVGVPCKATTVERRAIREAVDSAGVREVYLIPEPLAAAIGAGLPVNEASGSVIADIGGGTTELALLAMDGVVLSNSVRIGGDKMDEAIANHMRREHNILVGESTAERIKREIGCAHSGSELKTMQVRGRHLSEGTPRSVEANSDEIRHALQEPLGAIAQALHLLLEQAPPELAADIGERGITMAGGGCQLRDIDKYISDYTKVPVSIATDPMHCVAIGGGIALDYIDKGWEPAEFSD